MLFVSYRSRPISVLLPSSTLPAVMKRRTPRSSTSVGGGAAVSVAIGHSKQRRTSLEVSLSLAPLHRGLRRLIVHPRRAALGDLLDGGLADDLVDGRCLARHRARAA